VTLAAGSISQAAIIGVDCQTQGKGVWLNSWDWDEVAYDLTLNEDVDRTAGTVLAGFATDDYVDPIVWIRKSVENDTTFAWTDYHINLFLDRTFDHSQCDDAGRLDLCGYGHRPLTASGMLAPVELLLRGPGDGRSRSASSATSASRSPSWVPFSFYIEQVAYT